MNFEKTIILYFSASDSDSSLSTPDQIGIVVSCFLLLVAATMAAVLIVQRDSGTSVDGARAAAAAPAPANRARPKPGSGHSKKSRSSRKSRGLDDRRNRPKTPTVIKETSDNSSVTASTFSLTNDVPVTVVYQDTGEKFSAI